MEHIQIAIDGPSGAGKSTMAKIISKKLGILYLDTGAMYRALAFKTIRAGVDTKDKEKVSEFLPCLDIRIEYENGSQRVLLDGEDITDFIRTDEISMGASNVSAISEVRVKLVELQQKIAHNNSVIMDGRDIGTHVLPNADIKIFLTASVHDRAKRRFIELQEKGILSKSFEELEKEIQIRDYNDSNREASPLRQAEDAILVDTSGYTIDQSVERIMHIIHTKGFTNAL